MECGLLDNLQHGEKVIVDSGYGHNNVFIRPGGIHNNYEKWKVTVGPVTEQSTTCSRNGTSYKTIFDLPFKNMALSLGPLQTLYQCVLNLMFANHSWWLIMVNTYYINIYINYDDLFASLLTTLHHCQPLCIVNNHVIFDLSLHCCQPLHIVFDLFASWSIYLHHCQPIYIVIDLFALPLTSLHCHWLFTLSLTSSLCCQPLCIVIHLFALLSTSLHHHWPLCVIANIFALL